MAKKFEDLTPAEKQAAYEKWVESRTARRANSAIKREATKQLIAKYPDDYDALVAAVKAGKTPKGK